MEEKLRTYRFDNEIDFEKEFKGTKQPKKTYKALLETLEINGKKETVHNFKDMYFLICKHYYEAYKQNFINKVKEINEIYSKRKVSAPQKCFNKEAVSLICETSYQSLKVKERKRYRKLDNQLYVLTAIDATSCLEGARCIITKCKAEDDKISIKYYQVEDYEPAEWTALCSHKNKNIKNDADDQNEEFDADAESADEEECEIVSHPLNTILYGPPGTGKTYNTVQYAIAIEFNRSHDEIANIYNNATNEDSLKKLNSIKSTFVKSGIIKFVTFHQSFGYEEFVEGIKPKVENEHLSYEIVPGVFKEFCEKARDDSDHKYIFIIDEINRGNISKIFGELITLIEDTKREGMPDEASVVLPYSKEKFSVPQNVYIIGTMNTADRSIAIMDTALRRRFNFVEMMPDEQLLDGIIVDGIDITQMLKTMNDRIEALYDREHTIGHAFFCPLKNEPTLSKLAEIFKTKIIPLLQEYFYEDYEKIRLVLGDHAKDTSEQFVLCIDNNIPELFKGKNIDKYTRRIAEVGYTFNKDAFTNPNSYIDIYK